MFYSIYVLRKSPLLEARHTFHIKISRRSIRICYETKIFSFTYAVFFPYSPFKGKLNYSLKSHHECNVYIEGLFSIEAKDFDSSLKFYYARLKKEDSLKPWTLFYLCKVQIMFGIYESIGKQHPINASNRA